MLRACAPKMPWAEDWERAEAARTSLRVESWAVLEMRVAGPCQQSRCQDELLYVSGPQWVHKMPGRCLHCRSKSENSRTTILGQRNTQAGLSKHRAVLHCSEHSRRGSQLRPGPIFSFSKGLLCRCKGTSPHRTEPFYSWVCWPRL